MRHPISMTIGVMRHRFIVSLAVVASAVSLLPSAVAAFDDSKYPAFKGRWDRIGSPRWLSEGQQPPVTAEWQQVYAANLTDQASGGPGDMASWYCLPQGMPTMMSLYDPMEIVVTPKVAYILIQHINDMRRIYTDGRPWPKDIDPT